MISHFESSFSSVFTQPKSIHSLPFPHWRPSLILQSKLSLIVTLSHSTFLLDRRHFTISKYKCMYVHYILVYFVCFTTIDSIAKEIWKVLHDITHTVLQNIVKILSRWARRVSNTSSMLKPGPLGMRSYTAMLPSRNISFWCPWSQIILLQITWLWSLLSAF